MAVGFFLLAAPLVIAAILADGPTAVWTNGAAAGLFAAIGLVLALKRRPPA